MDCAVIPLARHKRYSLVQTVDFFYPLVDDPIVMGRIALANVVSDVYAVGVTEIDRLSMLVSAPSEFTDHERDTVVPLVIKGFQEAAEKLANCRIEVQHITINPWFIIGGIASSVCTQEEIIMPSNAVAGDAIVLTKPLGTQLATNCFIWLQERNDKYDKLAVHFSEADIEQSFQMAIKSMTYLNRNAARLMHKYSAHAATDVTGFGLLGHAKNLAEFQKNMVQFEISQLPIIKNILKFATLVSQDAKLKSGRAVETSGGLLICMPADNAERFCEEFAQICNGEQRAWIVGRVTEAKERGAFLVDEPELLEVEL